jgi:hypothetical protein
VTAVIYTGNVALPLDNHYVLGLIPTPALAVNQSWQATVPVQIPWCAQNRGWDIGCYADADEVIGEISEANNFSTYASRGVSTYSGADRRIAYHPKLRTAARNQDTATLRSTVGGDSASICVLRGSADTTAQHYLLIWSFQQSPFAFDTASELSLALVNGPIFARWFSTINDPNGARITLPPPVQRRDGHGLDARGLLRRAAAHHRVGPNVDREQHRAVTLSRGAAAAAALVSASFTSSSQWRR